MLTLENQKKLIESIALIEKKDSHRNDYCRGAVIDSDEFESYNIYFGDTEVVIVDKFISYPFNEIYYEINVIIKNASIKKMILSYLEHRFPDDWIEKYNSFYKKNITTNAELEKDLEVVE